MATFNSVSKVVGKTKSGNQFIVIKIGKLVQINYFIRYLEDDTLVINHAKTFTTFNKANKYYKLMNTTKIVLDELELKECGNNKYLKVKYGL